MRISDWSSDVCSSDLNPVRLEFLRDRIADRFGRNTRADRPLAGLAVLDVGCGGGPLCEPMTRLGAAVTGIDAGEGNVELARAPAEAMGSSIDRKSGVLGQGVSVRVDHGGSRII